MRNPALHLIGIAASPGGGEGIFGSRAEEELRRWLEARLDALGIDPVAYSRFVLSILRRPDSALSPPVEAFKLGIGTGCRSCDQSKAELLTCDNREQRQAVIQCLTSAADDKYGVEALVDELCTRVRELDGRNSCNEEEEQLSKESKTHVELSPRDKALRYYTAFPALQSVSIKKFAQRKDRNLNNNKNNGISLHNTKNAKSRNKKATMSINIESSSQSSEDKESFGFAKSMERERELEISDQLAKLEAKIKSSQEIWGPSNAQSTASIWAAPTYGPPTISTPLGWPIDVNGIQPIFSPSDNNHNVGYNASNQQQSNINEPHNIDLNEDNANNQGEMSVTVAKRRTDWPFLSPGSLFYHTRVDAAGQAYGSSFPPNTSTGASNASRMSLEVKVLEPDEDLLESDRTHFCPIRNGYVDGTTFPVNNSLEQIRYRRSQSGRQLYLMDDDIPYQEFIEKESASPEPNSFTLKFRLRQGCDKSVQTEQGEIVIGTRRGPARHADLNKENCCPYISDTFFQHDAQQKENDNESFTLDPVGWENPLHGRRRRHSSFGCQPLRTLRPLTL